MISRRGNKNRIARVKCEFRELLKDEVVLGNWY